MKVAQYEALGKVFIHHPSRTGRSIAGCVRAVGCDKSKACLSSLAGRTRLVASFSQHFVLGTFIGPSGTKSSLAQFIYNPLCGSMHFR
jgi:hypothetical protein